MKQLQGQASATVAATIDDSYSLVRAVDRYPSWNHDLFREVEVLERDQAGDAIKARAKLRVAWGRFAKEFELVVAVRGERPTAVYLERIPHGADDEERLELTWSLQDEGATRIALELNAILSSLPSLIPLGGAGAQVAGSLVKSVARALG